MQKIKLVVVGTIKEKYFKDAIAEYSKRLTKYADFSIIEVPECFASNLTEEQIKQTEANSIAKHLSGYVVAFDLGGKDITSVGLAELIKTRAINSDSKITFIIGGSIGLSSQVLNMANEKINFGKITYPHQLMRVIACEQIYRAFTIINNVKYHK